MHRYVRTTSVALAIALIAPSGARAQCDTLAPRVLPVRTFQLKHLAPDQAAKLIAPYVQGVNSGVFSAGSNIPAITVRASQRTLGVVDSVLEANDQAPATIILHFQLIAAGDSVVHDAAIADVDAALRGLFRFRGYWLLAEGAAVVSTGSTFKVSMTATSEPRADPYSIEGHLWNVSPAGAYGSADLEVNLHEPPSLPMRTGAPSPVVAFSTGLTVPLGQTVVLGSAAGNGAMQALILAVRAELAPAKR